jgi:hypothetical protein
MAVFGNAAVAVAVVAMSDEHAEQERKGRAKAAIERDRNWDHVRDGVFEHPEGPHVCPFCGQPKVYAAWELYVAEPRGAIFDAWCNNCGERHHCAAILPAHAPDCFHAGSVATAERKYELLWRLKRQWHRWFPE